MTGTAESCRPWAATHASCGYGSANNSVSARSSSVDQNEGMGPPAPNDLALRRTCGTWAPQMDRGWPVRSSVLFVILPRLPEHQVHHFDRRDLPLRVTFFEPLCQVLSLVGGEEFDELSLNLL